MKSLLLALSVTLTACTTVPVSQEFPVLPAELQVPCAPLETIDTPEVTLSALMKKVVTNYEKRHDCAAQTEALLRWYQEQKKIFDEANN